MDKWINDFGYGLLDGVFMDETMSVYEDASLKQLYFDSIDYIRKGIMDMLNRAILERKHSNISTMFDSLTKELNSLKAARMHLLLEMLVKQHLLTSLKLLTQAGFTMGSFSCVLSNTFI